jgi:hypothetical protein
MRLSLALLALALFAATSVEAATTTFAPCPRLDGAAKLPLRPASHVLRGDVDGDAARDRVAMHFEPRARSTCAFVLTITTAHGTFAARVPDEYKGLARSGRWFARQFPEPAVASLVRIHERGLVVIVPIWHGASTVGARPFWIAQGRVVGPSRGLTFYGSIAHNNQVDCYRGAGSGLIVETGEWIANDAGTRWSFSRAVSRVTNRGIRLVRHTTITVGTKKAGTLERRWHLGAPPFRSCTVAGHAG